MLVSVSAVPNFGWIKTLKKKSLLWKSSFFCWKRSTRTSKSLSPQQKPLKSGVDYIFPVFFSGPPKKNRKNTEKNHHPGGGHLENFFRWARKMPGYGEGGEGRRSFDEMFWGVDRAVTIKPCCHWVKIPSYMDVSENGATPKSSILIGFSIINHPFWGTPVPLFSETPLYRD